MQWCQSFRGLLSRVSVMRVNGRWGEHTWGGGLPGRIDIAHGGFEGVLAASLGLPSILCIRLDGVGLADVRSDPS
jgi:hypothetical protein